MKRYSKSIFCLFFLGLMGCDVAPENIEGKESVIQIVNDTALPMPESGEIRAPLNCPVMITSHSFFSKSDNKQYLSFILRENPNFDVDRGDACKGDLKNIWVDLNRFELEIESHMPNIRHISGASMHLKYFPKTEQDLRIFLDQEVRQSSLGVSLSKIGRANLDAEIKSNSEVFSFFKKANNAYWIGEQAPIIETILSKQRLKMKRYETAKQSYCYHPYDLCTGVVPSKKTLNETGFDFEYYGALIDWFSFQTPD